jgi:hypothetical protein
MLAKCPSAGYARINPANALAKLSCLKNCRPLFLDVAGYIPSARMSWGNADVL